MGGVLTPRQELLLRKVVEGFQTTGQPVGSKALAADPEITCGPSTVRSGLLSLLDRTGADELMIVSDPFDFRDRLRSFEIIAEVSRTGAGVAANAGRAGDPRV